MEFDPKNYDPKFDLIIGTNTMRELGIVLDFSRDMIMIDKIDLPMRKIDEIQKPNKLYQMYKNTEPDSTKELTKRALRILDAKYEKADLPAIVSTCDHLNESQKEKLLQVLQKFETLFDGTLGDWNTTPVHFELKEGAKPYHGRPFPVPRIHRETMKKEVDRMVKLGIMKWEGESEWAFPSFIIPKSNQTVRFISDFRELNKLLKRKPWPLPKIVDTLQQLEGFTYASQLDLNMGYYTIRLDDPSAKICTIILPWGKYSYQRLPMGVAGSPDIFQEKMSALMSTLEYVFAYIDDLLIISRDSFENHLEKLEVVLTRLRDAGLKINAAKSTFGVHECDYLGYVLTREGIKPQRKKIEAILAIDPPKDVKSLRGFLGIVQYYRDLWEKRSEMLAPLSDLVAECGTTKAQKKAGKKKIKKPAWHWDAIHQKAFDEIKEVIARDVVLAYPDFDETFEIYTDASTRQLGAVITQKNRPIAFFSRKLTDTQRRYTVTEQELLAIVETLKEFKGMLWGQKIKIYTDHKNLTRDALGESSDRVYRWRLLLEEYAPEIVYIKGINNTVADAISRLDYTPRGDVPKNANVKELDRNQPAACHAAFMQSFADENDIDVDQLRWKTISKLFNSQSFNFSTGIESVHGEGNPLYEGGDHVGLSLYNRSSEEQSEIYPPTVSEIADAQRSCKKLKPYFRLGGEKVDDKYVISLVGNTEVLVDKRQKMVIPSSLKDKILKWYHHYLQHPGSARLEATIGATMTWDGLQKSVRSFTKKCPSCQKNKHTHTKYSKLPEKLCIIEPWHTLCVDLIGPYTLKGKDGSELDFMCLTMMDAATGWFEIVELPVVEKPLNKNGKVVCQETFDKTSDRIARLVNKTWFCRYPRPVEVVFDNGSEFKLYFLHLLDSYGVTKKPTTVKNPQANGILERSHQTFGNMLRTAELDMADSVKPEHVEDFIDNAAWALRSTHHTVLKTSPGAAIFGRDMMFNIPMISDWSKIGEYRQAQTKRNTDRENALRSDYDYAIGERVLVRKDGILRKAETKWTGPFTITAVHTNGTIRIQRGALSERLNIRRCKPYFDQVDT